MGYGCTVYRVPVIEFWGFPRFNIGVIGIIGIIGMIGPVRMRDGDWRLGIGDWGLEIGDWRWRLVCLGCGVWWCDPFLFVGVVLWLRRDIAGRVIWFGRVLSVLGRCGAQGSVGDATLLLDATL